MPSSLASLLHQSLDFAGLFPPASLPASEALRIFRQEQAANTAGMLARFVSPMIRLDEIASGATADMPLVVSALPRGGKNAGEFLANLETDLAAIRRLTQVHDGAISIDTIEVRPPVDALEPAALRKLLAAIDALLVQKAGGIRQVFVELAPSPALAGQLAVLAEQSAAATQTGRSTFGYKLRTGGSDAASVPSAAMAAGAIAAAAALGIAMKCTGGLHRPLRPAAIAGGVPMHGFINLLVASTLAATAPTEAATLESVLEETEPTAFAFAGNTVIWSDRRLTTAEIATARKRFLVSFGSCYAEQPRTELLKLGWWPKSAPSKSALVASN
jgi:hypothetical protein